MPRRCKDIFLSDEEKAEIEQMLDEDYKYYPQTILARCRILLALDRSTGYSRTRQEVADIARVSLATVTKVAKLYDECGLASALSLNRNPKSDIASLKVDNATELLVVTLACSQVPFGRSRWSLRLLRDKLYLDYKTDLGTSTINRILKSNDIKPHLLECWCIPPNANGDFVAAMEQVIEVYLRPYDKDYPVFCLDEKPLQKLGHKRARIPMDCGCIEKQDSEYDRCGTCAIFVGIEPHTGFMYVEAREQRTRIDFAYVIKKICDEIYPNAKKITIVCDNLNTHNVGSLYEALGKEKAHELANRIEFVYTPKHGSWLDIAEIGINIMTTECLANRRIRELKAISENLSAWVAQHNQEKKPISWQFTIDVARTKLAHLYPDIKPDPATEKKPGKSDKPGAKATGSNGEESCETMETETSKPKTSKLESLEPGELIYEVPSCEVLRMVSLVLVRHRPIRRWFQLMQ